MKRWIAVLLFAACTLCAEEAAEHPRLFGSSKDFAALRERVTKEPLVAIGAKKVIQPADEALALEPCKRVMKGRRLLMLSREVLRRVSHLGLAYQLTSEKKYADRAAKEMLSAAAFKDWNPGHFLDVGEMTLALAIGYDWCYQALPAETRATILKAIIQHGLDASETGEQWWIKGDSNWGQVCHAGILAGALVLPPEESARRERLIKRAVEGLPYAMKVFDPQGGFPEGPMYWEYALEFNVLAIELLEHVEGHDYGLSQLPGFKETADYLNLVTGPSAEIFGYADARPQMRQADPPAWWFAKRYSRPDVASAFEREAYERYCASSGVEPHRLFPFCVLWCRTPAQLVMNIMTTEGCIERRSDLPIQSPLCWRSKDENEVVTQRTSWDRAESVFVGLKAGKPSAHHAHMDCGSFVLDRFETRWVEDLGLEEYTAIEKLNMKLWSREQNSDRWKIFRLGNKSHNVLILNDELQRTSGRAVVMAMHETGGTSKVTLDLSALYPSAKQVERTSCLSKSGAFEMCDVVKAEAGTRVRWQILTRAQATVGEDGGVTLTRNNKVLKMTAQQNPKVKWQAEPTDSYLQSWDSPNPGVTMVWFEEPVPVGGELKLSVTFDR